MFKNKALEELKQKELGPAPADLHGEDDSRFAFSPGLITKESISLRGTSVNEKGKGGYRYNTDDDTAKTMLRLHAYGLGGRKGNLQDGDGNIEAELVIEHHFKTDTHRYYKTEACYEGQESEAMDDKDLYLFAKIDGTRTAKGSSSTYSVVTGKDTFKALYKAEQVVSRTFMALVKTASGVDVGRLTPLRGPHLLAEVTSGVDLAAVILTGEACAPTAGSILSLPGATLI